MAKIWILIHGNRFLMNTIKLLSMKILLWPKRFRSSLIQSVLVSPDICGCYHIIQYSIYNHFPTVLKNVNLETKNILKKSTLPNFFSLTRISRRIYFW